MKRQVVFLMTDTTRKDMVGCYGNEKMKTPNLDRLAAEGIRYENAYTCQPVCGPARSAIFTGTFPHTNGMVTNSIAMGDNVKTIGQRLSDHGIACGYIGKYHLDGGDYFGNGRCPEGWNPDYWYDMKTYLNELSDADKVRSRDPKEAYKEGFSEEFTYAHRCSNRAIRYLEEFQDQDFFLTVSYDEPHGPSLCPAPFNHMYGGFQFEHNPSFQDDLSKKPFMQRLWAGKNLYASEEKINQASDGIYYLVIHSGSRNLGKQVAEYYQQLAVDLHMGKEEYFAKRDEIIKTYKAAGRRNEIQEALKELKKSYKTKVLSIPEDLCWLYGRFLDDYLHDVEICQSFARRNREKMAEIILERTGMTQEESLHTIHNYIDTEEMILRKAQSQHIKVRKY